MQASEDRRRSLTERVIVNFSPEQVDRLKRYIGESGDAVAPFIRRTTLEKLTELGFGPERTLGELVQEARRDVKPGSR
jgi:hypothetical protein